ncbi:MAG TPA: hypothetical protein VNY56_00895 [Methylomirabilota bacterium]|nr:hypothetical protein [Methylomirabilota bacterium]
MSVLNLTDFCGMLVFDKWTCNTNGRQAIFYRDAGVRVSASDPAPYSADESRGGIR